MKKLLIIFGIILVAFFLLAWRKDGQWKMCKEAQTIQLEKYKDSKSFYVSRYINATPDECRSWLLKIPF